MVHIIDAAQNTVPALHKLVEYGITGIIRYDCRLVNGRWKEASNIEIGAILSKGLNVGIVNEGVGNVASAFNEQSGYLDACYSLARAAGRAQPEGSAIYYAVDFDASSGEISSHIIPYFMGVRKAHQENIKKWRVGAYCSGLVALELKTRNLTDLTWITCSSGFAGSRAYVNAGKEDLWQYQCEKDLFSLDVDFNLTPTGDYGQWHASTPPETATNQPAYFTQTGKASWYADARNADGTPVDNTRDLTAAHRTLPFGTRVRVTRLDQGNAVDVTIHDRGPYVDGRIIDLRPRAAATLDMQEAGVVPVKIEELP